MAKKTAPKKPKASVTKITKAAEAVAAPLAAPEREPTPRELVEEALSRANEAVEKLELSVQLLNAGAKGVIGAIADVERRKNLVASLKRYVETAHFQLTSYRDEVMVALEQNKDEGRKPSVLAFSMPIPEVPFTSILKDATSKEDAAAARDTVGFTLQFLAATEIPATQCEQMLRVLTFTGELHKSLKALAGDAKVAA